VQGLEQELAEHQRLARNDAQRVAVGRGFRAGAGADVEGAAGPVLDDDRLAEALVQLVAERTHEDIAGAAGAGADDHPDRTVRVVLGGERRGGEAQRCRRHES
jgi:hypothetical protein